MFKKHNKNVNSEKKAANCSPKSLDQLTVWYTFCPYTYMRPPTIALVSTAKIAISTPKSTASISTVAIVSHGVGVALFHSGSSIRCLSQFPCILLRLPLMSLVHFKVASCPCSFSRTVGVVYFLPLPTSLPASFRDALSFSTTKAMAECWCKIRAVYEYVLYGGATSAEYLRVCCLSGTLPAFSP